ncbi:MAG: decaprenyl-phosphate phosphoribosyltransferase [Candidatus Nanopelagicales bacterium]|nr:decaprenyl-phosphate phosphoribosyltransferase [Candidatus Nanopelagicales bacterium]
MTRARALLTAARPKQWVKNVLVFAAPVAAGVILQPKALLWTLLAFFIFCCAASATYMTNDVLDVEADRQHASKRNRAIAAGIVSPRTAGVVAAVLALISLVLPLLLGNPRLAAIIAGYLVLQAAYVWRLKHEAVLDVASVAAGFLLRAIAGGVATGVVISNAFLVVVGFGALFMAVGKRYSEIMAQDQSVQITRRSLAGYTPGYLRTLIAISGSVALVGYVLWALEIDRAHPLAGPWASLSIIPFTLAMMRFARDADAALAEAPEDVVLADPVLLILGLIWVGLFVAQVAAR